MQNVIGLGPRGHDTYTEHELINLPFTWIENEAIWQFLWYRIHDSRTRQIEKCCCDTKSMSTWEAFRSHTGSGRPLWKLKNYFQEELAPTLSTAFLAEDTKIELYFGLGIPINMEFYNSIKLEGYIDLDSVGRICRFVADDGLNLAKRRYQPEMEYETMWEFLRRRVHCPRNGKLLHPTEIPCEFALWKEYKESYPVNIGVPSLLKIYREEMVPKIHETNFNLITKAKLCFVLRIPVIQELFEEFLKIAIVNLNGLRRIVYFNEHGTGVKWYYNESIATERSNFRRSAFTEQEEIAMFTFVYHKIQDHKTKRIRRDKSILQSKELWVEFNKTNRVHREPTTYMRRFKSIMMPVCYLAKISKMMKMALHFALEVPVHEDLLAELRKTAIVELNREGCIIAYKERQKRVHGNESSEVLIDLEDEPAPKVEKSDPEIIAAADAVSDIKISKPVSEINESVPIDDEPAPKIQKSDSDIISLNSESPKPTSEINKSEIELLLQPDGDTNENLGDLIPEEELLLMENPEFAGAEEPDNIQKEVQKLVDQMISELDMEEQELKLFTLEPPGSLKTDSLETFVTAPNSPLDGENQNLIPSAPEHLQELSEATKIICDAPESDEDGLESFESPEFFSEKLSQEGSVSSSVNTVVYLGPAPENDYDDADSMSTIEIKEVVEEIIQKIEAQQ